VADVYSDKKGWPAFRDRQRFGVLLGLVACAKHGLVPAMRTANGGAATGAQWSWWGRRKDEVVAIIHLE
jgi:hypothetical protein